jgi:DNA (cytosine-5)-methyltransferase 1
MKKTIKVGSDFSGVGAFDQALSRLEIDHKTIFACDMDKYARTTYIHNYGEPNYYPTNVYERIIPEESLDLYLSSPPCQSFSLAGKREGKNDKRGILFFNSHEFIATNKPRFFIFENVKGLLSDDNGNTFQEWINMLGGKSINGLPVIFPYEDSVPYHVYWQVLNSKKHGVPQNRERVFIIGIRDDHDNTFRFPVEEHLTKKLKDVLENNVDEKYFLSHKMIEYISKSGTNGFYYKPDFIDENAEFVKPITTAQDKRSGVTNYLKIKSATSSGYEIATEGDSVNLAVPNSETRRGRVGKQVAQTLDTNCNQGVIQINRSIESNGRQPYQQNRIYDENGISPSLLANLKGDRNHNILNDYKIRRLTPRECFRLMDFPDSFDFSCVSDSQAYKQAGNSIVVRVLEKIIKNLSL